MRTRKLIASAASPGVGTNVPRDTGWGFDMGERSCAFLESKVSGGAGGVSAHNWEASGRHSANTWRVRAFPLFSLQWGL